MTSVFVNALSNVPPGVFDKYLPTYSYPAFLIVRICALVNFVAVSYPFADLFGSPLLLNNDLMIV